MILLIDNYDSFTHNLYQLVAQFYSSVKIVRNDKISLEQIAELKPKAILFSPGPGRPENAGICVQAIQAFAPKIPILGVCLGHQAIGYAFGANVNSAKEILHGKESLIFHNRKGIFQGIILPCLAGRYHSLVVEAETLPDCLEVIAEDKQGTVMAIKHRDYQCYGLQFHPESILTKNREQLIVNFLQEAGLC